MLRIRTIIKVTPAQGFQLASSQQKIKWVVTQYSKALQLICWHTIIVIVSKGMDSPPWANKMSQCAITDTPSSDLNHLLIDFHDLPNWTIQYWIHFKNSYMNTHWREKINTPDCHDIGFIFRLFHLVIIKCRHWLAPSCKFPNEASIKACISRILPTHLNFKKTWSDFTFLIILFNLLKSSNALVLIFTSDAILGRDFLEIHKIWPSLALKSSHPQI